MKKSINPVWGGRFEKKSSDLLQKINNSIGFDYKLALQDVKLNIEYAKSLKKAKIITGGEFKKIEKALKEICQQISDGKFEFSHDFEDIHMNIEMSLKKRLEIFQVKSTLENPEMIRWQLILRHGQKKN